MRNTAVKLAEIKKKLSRLPGYRLNEVEDFIGFLLSGSETKSNANVQLRGIWEGKGFERIDAQKEIRSLRKRSSESVLQKGF